MLVGSAAVGTFPAGSVSSWDAPAAELDGLELLQAMFELPSSARESVLPPALHPTNPATVVVQAWRCTSSPWGAFALVQLRVQCRSGLRPRGFVVGSVCDSSEAATGLGDGWGFSPRAGQVRLRRGYDEVALDVEVGGVEVLALRGRDPDPLGADDVGYSSTLNLAETPNGLRLVQLDLSVAPQRVERLRPTITAFDAASWGQPLLRPTTPVSASIAVGRATLEPVRYCCRPDVLAFEGTETVRQS